MYPLRLVHDLRPTLPWTIFSLPIDIPGGSDPQVHSRRFAVRWDEDNDERVLGAVLDAYYSNQESIWNLYAISERKASLTVFTQEVTAKRRETWRKAASSPSLHDVWDLEMEDTYGEIARLGDLRALERAQEGDRRRYFSPAHDQLNALIDLFELGPTGARRPWE